MGEQPPYLKWVCDIDKRIAQNFEAFPKAEIVVEARPKLSRAERKACGDLQKLNVMKAHN